MECNLILLYFDLEHPGTLQQVLCVLKVSVLFFQSAMWMALKCSFTNQPTNPPTNQPIPSVKCPGKAWPNAVALRWRRNSIPTNLHVWVENRTWKMKVICGMVETLERSDKKIPKAIMLWLWNGLEDEFFQEGWWLLLVLQGQNGARGRIN